MRIDVSAEPNFFANPQYPNLEQLLAAAAAGCISVNATNQGDPIDVQVNPVIMAEKVGQYLFTPNTKKGSFGEASRGRSVVTMEIDHINTQSNSDNEDLLCRTAVALVTHFFGLSCNQNCWMKYYGGFPGTTNWCDSEFSLGVAAATSATVAAFADGDINASEMVERLIKALVLE